MDVNEPDPDLDSMTRDQLAELSGPELVVSEVLDDWRYRQHGIVSSAHGVGLFLDLLAAEGYRVTPIDVPEGPMIPPPTE